MEFASAQDHKRVGEGERGPNTGGMGAYSPAPVMDARMRERVMRDDRRAHAQGNGGDGRALQGRSFRRSYDLRRWAKARSNTMCVSAIPKPQAMLPRLEEDLLALLLACVEERLPERPARLSARTALTVVLAAKGYPGAPVTGSEIHGIERAGAMPFVSIIHAGTKLQGQTTCRRRWPRPQRHRRWRRRGGRAGARLCGDRFDRLAGRILPPRHRLAAN